MPQACTLPTVERPLRLREFDSVFASALRRQDRVGAMTLRWVFDPAAGTRVRDLTERESVCCSFFEFNLSDTNAGLLVEVTVPPNQGTVLDALQERSGRWLRS